MVHQVSHRVRGIPISCIAIYLWAIITQFATRLANIPSTPLQPLEIVESILQYSIYDICYLCSPY
ncbi:uncharacterized protein CANTADRAFT_216762 [Suhomyces tanzawaensis NRRL Y-17324]|uniref:Uncharacterized protein n=1 Tax=Suhomyces tanzawaensis NRRL Y-17324 TaxID=984487 RepID=A0A1E4SJX5_9ASCO|nr:uncharacterized protein CANTADRAFT_216762 [Suhomyces tanzawaensis NRRL Y-17324]ODV79815.1 hypothetical protein CANTADRAFT_216762 [Suhomyces tanzawaensis NRRL Y-17324]